MKFVLMIQTGSFHVLSTVLKVKLSVLNYELDLMTKSFSEWKISGTILIKSTT